MIGFHFAALTALATDLPKDNQGGWPIALRFGTACDAVLVPLKSGAAGATFKTVAAGETIPCKVRQVTSVSAGVIGDVVAIYEYPV